MNKQTISYLLISIVVMLGLVWLVSTNDSQVDESIGEKAFPAVIDNMESIDRIEIRSAESSTSLALEDKNWVVTDRGNYVVKFSSLSELFDGLKDAQLLERKTAKPDQHGRLGLAGTDTKGSNTRRLVLYRGDEIVADLLVGNTSSKLKGSYMRFGGEDQTWLLNLELDTESSPRSWLKNEILDIPEDQVLEVTQTSPEGKVLHLLRNDDDSGNFVPDAIPAGKKLKYDTVANSLARGLVNLNLIDVQATDNSDWKEAAETLFICRNGLRFRVRSRQVDESYFIRIDSEIDATADAAMAVAANDEVNPEPNSAKTGPSGDSPIAATEATEQEAVAEVPDYAVLLDPWIFEVTKYTFETFQKTTDDLFEDIDPKTDEDEEAAKEP